MTTSGGIAKSCCCGANPCAPDPSVIVTIAAADGNLPVSWCGITWEKSTTTITTPATQRHSGESAEVCPLFTYERFKGTFKVVGQTWYRGLELWVATNNTSWLWMERRWEQKKASPSVTNILNRVSIRKTGPPGWQSFHSVNAKSSYTTLAISLSLEPFATYNDYLLTDGFFGTYTNSGVTYTWARGNGW